MAVVLTIVRRNLRLFFRDRLNVFFSLLAAIILFGLYTLFLGNLQTADLAEAFPDATSSQIRAYIDSWMYAGIVSMTAITTGLGAFGVLVEDASSGRFRDFLVSPIGKGQLVLGYFLSALAIALTMTLILLAASVAALYFLNDVSVPLPSILRSIGYITLIGAAFAGLSAFLVSFIATPGAFAALSTTVGTVLGFLAGAYVPVGALPEGVRAVISALPFAQSSMLLRQEFTGSTLEAITRGETGAKSFVREFYGIGIQIGDWQVAAAHVVALLGSIAIIFTALAATRIRSRIAYR